MSLPNQISFMKKLLEAKKKSCSRLVESGEMKETEAKYFLLQIRDIIESLERLKGLEK